ncbi:MAG: thiamine diphosphokinase [Acidimicrobiia bacterium]
MGSVALVFAGGDPPPPSAIADLPAADLVVAADSGLHHAVALGFRVDLVVGDLDSVDPAALDAAAAAGTTVDAHPAAKDFTDLELALQAARNRGCSRAVVIGGAGGRVDHFLANLLLLASPEFVGLDVEARVGSADVFVVRAAREVRGQPGDFCSLLALGGPARGVHTAGLRFPLRGETLHPGSTRGLSNELLEPVAQVSLDDGVLLVVLPDARKAYS